MCTSDSGVGKRIDIVSISEDIAEFVKRLGNEVEVEINVDEIKQFEKRLQKFIAE
jgi:transcription antitermination factor NusA-like protein